MSSVAASRITGTIGGLMARTPITSLVPVAVTWPIALVWPPTQFVEMVVATGMGPMLQLVTPHVIEPGLPTVPVTFVGIISTAGAAKPHMLFPLTMLVPVA